MNLNEAQRQTVSQWIAAGAKLSEVQTRLASELEVKLTYLEVRLLVDDLKLQLKDPTPPPAPAVIPPATPPPAPAAAPIAATAPPAGGGKVSVSVDQLARPGALVSGKVSFSDGAQADWYLDQAGRLGLVPAQPGYKPAPGDIEQFQIALEREMAKLGF
jgi:hypothetical protein